MPRSACTWMTASFSPLDLLGHMSSRHCRTALLLHTIGLHGLVFPWKAPKLNLSSSDDPMIAPHPHLASSSRIMPSLLTSPFPQARSSATSASISTTNWIGDITFGSWLTAPVLACGRSRYSVTASGDSTWPIGGCYTMQSLCPLCPMAPSCGGLLRKNKHLSIYYAQPSMWAFDSSQAPSAPHPLNHCMSLHGSCPYTSIWKNFAPTLPFASYVFPPGHSLCNFLACPGTLLPTGISPRQCLNTALATQ